MYPNKMECAYTKYLLFQSQGLVPQMNNQLEYLKRIKVDHERDGALNYFLNSQCNIPKSIVDMFLYRENNINDIGLFKYIQLMVLTLYRNIINYLML